MLGKEHYLDFSSNNGNYFAKGEIWCDILYMCLEVLFLKLLICFTALCFAYLAN